MELLNLDQYKEHFQGFGLRDCAVRTNEISYFVLVQDWDDDKPRPFDEELESRVVSLFVNYDDKWSHSALDGFGGLMAGASDLPKSQGVMVDRGGRVFVIGGGVSEVENRIASNGNDGPRRGAVTHLKQINGHVFGCDNSRSLFRRIDRNRWEPVGVLPPTKSGETGFRDFDVFSETDIYAAGGKGDVWHYDGKVWKRIAFPSNMWLESVCCGQDGYVYIGAQSGSVFRGRGSEWRLIHKGDLSLPFKDLVWFGDSVYATNDYGLWEIQGETVRQSAEPIEITNCAGNLSVGDGVMLMAGAYGAALHDGTKWEQLFSLAELQRQALGYS